MDGKDRDINESSEEPWGYSHWERQCIEEVESRPDLDEQTVAEKEQALQRLWMAFQNAAMACAQLYKERQNTNHTCGGRLWTPFQDTANTVALLYKEGLDLHKYGLEAGHQTGCCRRNKDLLSWAKKKRKLIRRDELLSYLAGRSPPRRISDVRLNSSTVGSNGMDFETRDSGTHCYDPLESLEEEDEAPATSAPFFVQPTISQSYHGSPRRRSYNESSLEGVEGREGRKRSSTSMDITMDSPHKRSRYL